MNNTWKNFFFYSRSERNGIFLLSVLLLASLFLPGIVTRLFPEKQSDLDTFFRGNEQLLSHMEKTDSAEDIQTEIRLKTHQFQYAENYWHKSEKQQFPLKEKKKIRVEINTADSVALLDVPGIGPYFAHKILAYRNRLGGFLILDQLLEIKGITPEKLLEIQGFLTVNPDEIRQISFNTASFRDLLRHPYSNYQITKDLVNFRQKYGALSSLDELQKSQIIPDSVFRKLKPYLTVDP